MLRFNTTATKFTSESRMLLASRSLPIVALYNIENYVTNSVKKINNIRNN